MLQIVPNGYTPLQWACGQQFSFSDEDQSAMSRLMPTARDRDFTQLMANRSSAEDIARKVRAQSALGKLRNSKARQPLQVFYPMELVKVWRKYAAEQGPRGGMHKTFRAQWLGPGRVVFHEVLQGQRPEDQRRHIVWVVTGGTMHRCSVHSIRKVTERERLRFMRQNIQKPGKVSKTFSQNVPM